MELETQQSWVKVWKAVETPSLLLVDRIWHGPSHRGKHSTQRFGSVYIVSPSRIRIWEIHYGGMTREIFTGNFYHV